MAGNKNPPQRKNTTGWTEAVSRRLKQWLYSIPIETLDGHGLAFTLTVRDCPESSSDWATLRNSFVKRLVRDNCVRLQWLTEWQQRGVPHLHGIAYFESEYAPHALIDHWIALTAEAHGAAPWSQDCKPVHNVLGWLDYLAKHAARSYTHYQRSSDNIPAGWSKTGRMWGYRGDWNSREPMDFYIDQAGHYRFRRIAKAVYHSNVRTRFLEARRTRDLVFSRTEDPAVRENANKQYLPHLRQFQISRRTLKCNDANTGRMMGTSDWLNQNEATRVVVWLGSQGHDVQQLHRPD